MSSSSSAVTTDITNADKAREKWKQFYARLIKQTRFESEQENENFLLHYLMAGKEDLGEYNEEKQQALVQALTDADWDADILNDENLEQIALQCFKDNLIIYQQLITLLERQQCQLDFGAIETHALLKEDEKYTEYAKNHFLPLLYRNLKHGQGISVGEKEEERLRCLIAALPRSEQIVYSSVIDETALYKDGVLPRTDIGNPSDSLLGSMQHEGVMLIDFNQYFVETIKSYDNAFTVEARKIPLISMSDGVTDAVSIALFGIKRYVNPVFRSKKIDVRDIEQGIRRGFRPTAITFKNEPSPEQIHEFENPGRVPATAHDKYHAGIMSRMTIKFRQALLYMVDIARRDLQSMHETEQMAKKQEQEQSKSLVTLETWLAVDAAWPISGGIAIFPSQEEIEKSTREFCKNLSAVTIAAKAKVAKSDNYSGFFDGESDVSVFGMIVFVDMLRNTEEWSTLFYIEPELLEEPFKEGYELIKRLSVCDPDFLEDPPELQALKLRVFQNIADMNDEELTDLFAEIANYYHEKVKEEIIVCKFVRGKQGGKLFHQQLLPNQVGLLVYPEHKEFFSEIHRKYFHEKESPESLSDDEEKFSNKCCCFFNSTKKRNSSKPKMDVTTDMVVEVGESKEKKNGSSWGIEVIGEDESATQPTRRSRCVLL